MQDTIYWHYMPDLQKKLEKVHKIILNNIKPIKGKLGEALYYNFEVAGKELRPAFVILFSQLGEKSNPDKILNIASSVEILHNATLIHDDIIDESDLRRGRESVPKKFGRHIALYTGDYLFALSLQLLTENTSKITNLRVNSKSMQDILAGETQQYGNEYNLEITKQNYLNQIRGKTAILFGYSCFIGALEGGLSRKKAQKAKEVGEKVGMAFQLRDDILDYTTSTETFKKPVIFDVTNGVYTGPLIFALEQDEEQKLRKLITIGKDLSQKQLAEIDQLVTELGGIEATQKLANQYTDDALKLLKKHFANYSGYSDIENLIESMLHRKY